ncbi:MAG: hypothetical protein MHPDNHAH_03258 [Anaerolineales bacterium]|nr:hypothetical protein [Anaerolineales bacterium]WKZ48439.1 MAG: hypothetical protein QY306_03595 [Anaerolineales bacterium]
MASNLLESLETWAEIQITRQDVEFLHNYLFEHETPLTPRELALVLIHERNRAERAAARKQQEGSGKVYFPKDSPQVGDQLVFPALAWKHGKVAEVRPGVNPEVGAFSVLTVDLDDGSRRMFASALSKHSLNDKPVTVENEGFEPDAIMNEYGREIEQKIEAAFNADPQLIRIAGRWFPRALLVDVNEGNLNLAEAVLDVSGGEPLPTSALLKDVALPDGVNAKLAEFSLNLALQEDGRFDEVGPAGEVLWYLKRLEPEEVQNVPPYLRYDAIEHDRSLLDQQMLDLESQLDDELSELDSKPDSHLKEVSIALIYPHLRAGTLPVSARVRSFFPVAYESPRVRFTLVDGKTRQRIPAWVVRKHGYVYGLRDWYKSNGLIPGSMVRIRRGDTPGEVVIEARTYRATKDWMRTAIVGADGGVVFAMLKQAVSAEFNDRMAFAVPSFDTVDRLWTQDPKRPFDRLVTDLTRELSKLTPQGHVHAQELYAAVNIVRRTPPAPLFALLAGKPEFVHVGDLHFRLGEAE